MERQERKSQRKHEWQYRQMLKTFKKATSVGASISSSDKGPIRIIILMSYPSSERLASMP
jgi:hypothetical protein